MKVRPILHLLDNRCIIFGFDFIRTLRKLQANAVNKITHIINFFFFRAFVISIQCRHLMLINKLRSGHIGCNHALFDYLVSIIAGGRHNFFNVFIFSKYNARFRGFKIDRTTTFTLF